MEKSSLEGGMALLQQNYLKKLDTVIKDLRRLREILTKGFLPVKDIQQLYRTTHNYAGSGATFGFPDISRTSRELHNALKKFLDTKHDKRKSVKETADLREKLEAFEEACRSALKKPWTGPQQQTAEPVSVKNHEKKTIAVFTKKKNQADDLINELQHFGYEVVSIEDMEALCLGIYDAVIIYSSLQAREISGIEAAAKAAPVILITPHDDFESRLTAVQAGVDGYFTSSPDILKIMDKIEQVSKRNAPAPAWNVLIIDDDEMLAEFYARSLDAVGMKTTVITNPKDCLKTLSAQAVDLILLDFSMPHCDGKELATIIRQHPEYVSLPIVFMSAKEDIEAELILTGLGIDDYLIKPFTIEQLAATVSSRARRAADLKTLMVCDSFTGLINHAHFLERFSSVLMDVQRNQRQSAYAMIDIDHFKKINDTYGHAAGDQVIKSLARMLQQQLRRSDIIGRCGGEEFGIIMPGCDLENAQRIMEALRLKFANSPFTIGKHKITVTLSGGLSMLDAKTPMEQTIAAVDAALYQAKAGGRNKIVTI